MIPITLAEVCAAVGGELVGDGATVVTGITIDSRSVALGDLFVAFAGERSDGHDFAGAALAQGAAAVMSQRPVAEPAVVVADPLAAVGRLATAVLQRLPQLTTIGVTGSSGKTSTKDLLAQVLAPSGPTIAPVGSFNNELGLPLTALRSDADTRFLVLEMGARGRGHIAYLCGIAPLDVGSCSTSAAPTWASSAARSRSPPRSPRSWPGCRRRGWRCSTPTTRWSQPCARGRRLAASSPSASRPEPMSGLRACGWTAWPAPSFDLRFEGDTAHVALQLAGEHMALNAARRDRRGRTGHLAAGCRRSPEFGDGAQPWRMEVTTTDGGVTVINDAYNANPESMRAALKALVAMARGGEGKTRS